MIQDRHRRAKELFLLACEVASEERAKLLERECGGDSELRAHVAELLAYYREPRARERAEPASRLAAGQIVDNKYAVEARLGAGGMGEVYLARQIALDRAVVVKVLTSDPLPDSLLRFEREARALARLKHENVVTVHDLGAAADVGHYLVMEYVGGGTLRDEARRGALPIATAVELMRQVCAGIAAAHDAGVIHRDLKPENILLENEGERVKAKVADFGIARLAEPVGEDAVSLTGTGTVMGTAHYMSPEQCRGQEADARSDVYAIGCVLFELLAGRPPFAAESVLGLLEKHRTEPPAALGKLRPDVPPALERAVARALEKSRERRWQSAAELGAALASGARNYEVDEFAVTDVLPATEAIPSERTVAASPSNLPQPLTRCIGRERELAEVSALLVDDAVRLVTITGTGGTGKTRLAVEVAHALSPSFPDGVFQVELAALPDPALLAQRVAQVFGVKESSVGPVAEPLARFLAEKRLLLLLDNFEHLLASAPLVARLLEAAPRLKVLVTSQATLHLRGEREYALGALDLPTTGAIAAPADLERSPAVALFVERARQETPSFAVTAENARAVAEVCRRVDGLPLAIELAAARVKLLSPAVLLGRLEHRLAMLTGGARDLPERQRTMRAALTWSYELLDEHERSLLRGLAVFSGGCTLDAAEAVCGHDGVNVLDALGSLVDKSLLRQREQPCAEARFGMLGVVREFALERLEAEGETEAARMRHARYYLALVLGVDPSSLHVDASQIASLGREHENFSTALATLIERAPRDAARMAIAFRPYWNLQSMFSEGGGWMRRVLATGGAGPGERASLLASLATTEGVLGRHQTARDHIREAVEACRALDDKSLLLDVLNSGVVLLKQAETSAEGRAYLEEALGIGRAIGDNNKAAAILVNLSAIPYAEGDFERVRSYNEEALDLTSSPVTRASCLLNLGDLSLDEGDLVAATERLREALVTIRQFGDPLRTAFALESLAEIAHRQGATEKAVRLAGAVEALYETTEGVRTYLSNEAWDTTFAKIRDALEPSIFERERARGRAMGLDEAVAYALRDD